MEIKEKTTEFDSLQEFHPTAVNCLKIFVSVHSHIFLGEEPLAFFIISELMTQTVENHWTRRFIVNLKMKEKSVRDSRFFECLPCVPVTDVKRGPDVEMSKT